MLLTELLHAIHVTTIHVANQILPMQLLSRTSGATTYINSSLAAAQDGVGYKI